jgi:prolipoprotein diacylglyceryl transferase
VFGSIPSPSKNVWNLGIGSFSIPLHVYGLMIALGVLAAVWISRKRWASWGNDPDLVIDLAYWGVPGGLIGARIYHVATDYNRLYVHNFTGMFKIWDGGLGIPGGILGGVFAGYLCARRHKASVPDLLDMVAPALPLAQAIGRLGNYFNQELFGRPTKLPWALEIDPAHRPVSFFGYATFQPTFAYEALWNLGLVGVLLAVDHHRGTDRPLSPIVVALGYGLFALGGGLDVLLVVQRQTSLGTPAQVGLFIVGALVMAGAFRVATGLGTNGLRRRADLFVLYIAGYFLGRLWVESLRIDTANTIAGLRLNEWTAILVGVGALLVLAWRGRVSEPRPIMAASGSVSGPPWTGEGADHGADDPASDSPDRTAEIDGDASDTGEVADGGASRTES